jgi:hypothetical protein
MEYLQEHTELIQKAVTEAIEDRYIHLEDEDGDGEATVNEISELYVDDVVGSDGNKMVLRCSATVDLTASVSYDDPDLTFWDSEDKAAYVGGYISAELERTIQCLGRGHDPLGRSDRLRSRKGCRQRRRPDFGLCG